jgi:flagellar basal body P-ring formation protein FlgA
MLPNQFIRHLAQCALLAACCGLPLLAPADDYEAVDNLKNIAKEFAKANIPVGADETLNIKANSDVYSPKLPVCHQKIVAEFPANTNPGQVTGVALYCNDAASWHTLVPVNVQILTKVLVAKRTILAKEEITDDLLDYETYDKNVLFDSYFKDKNEILGQVATHMISPGMVLTKRNLQAPVLIHKNQIVDLVATSHTVSVSMQGIAKSEGSLNETIKVYNPSSKRIVDAVVAGPNRAEVIA